MRGQTRLVHRLFAGVGAPGAGRRGAGFQHPFRRCGNLFRGCGRVALYHGKGILANQERGTGQLDADVAKVAETLDGPERGHSTAYSFSSGNRSRGHRLVGNCALECGPGKKVR